MDMDMDMDYNISDLEKLLNIHNEHEFIILYTERAKELLEILLEYFGNYTELIVFLQQELQIFLEWENDFFKDQNRNITYISLDNYEHENDQPIEVNFKKLISYLQMFHTGSKILFKFYNNLKQIDVTYDIQTYVNTLEEKYKNLFYNVHKIGPVKNDNLISESPSIDSIQKEFDKLSKRNNRDKKEDNNNEDKKVDINNEGNKEIIQDDYIDTQPIQEDEIIISNNGIEVENIGELLKDKNSTYSISIGDNKEKSEEVPKDNKSQSGKSDNKSQSDKSGDDKSQSDKSQSDKSDNNSQSNKSDNNSHDNNSHDNNSQSDKSDNNSTDDKSNDNKIYIDEDDKLFNLCNNVIYNMEEIKDTYMTLRENKNSIGICREALEKILSYGLNVESAINQLDTQEEKINTIIDNYNTIFQDINNRIDKNSQNMKNDLNGVQFKQQIKKINIQ